MVTKIKNIAFKLENILLISCFGLMGLVLFAQVIMRFIFNRPLMWSEEMVRFIQIWITFLGIGYGIRNSSHIAMVILYNKVNPTLQLILRITSNLIILICIIAFIPKAWDFISLQNQINSSAMGIRMSLVYIPIIIGSIIYIIYNLSDILSTSYKLINANKERGGK